MGLIHVRAAKMHEYLSLVPRPHLAHILSTRRRIMPHADMETASWSFVTVSAVSVNGKIVWSSVWRKIEESAIMPLLRSLPTTMLACLSLVWPELGLGLAMQD